MKIILLADIEKLGVTGDRVVVKSGYARNFLFPKNKAVLDTSQNLKILEEHQSKLSTRDSEMFDQSKSRAKLINDLKNIVIKARSSVKGKLFGSIGARDIARVLTDSVGFEVSKSQIRFPNQGLLKSLGIYNIKVHIYKDIYANITVTIVNILKASNDQNI